MFQLTLRNADQILDGFAGMIAASDDLSQPLARAALVLRDSAVRRIKEQGGDLNWPPNKRGSHTGIDTGRMLQSLTVGSQSGNTIRIGTNVVSETGFAYPRAFQEGTGVFAGRSAWTVKPKRAKFLSFVVNGRRVFARSVTIQGQPPRPFLFIDDTDRAKIVEIFRKWIVKTGGIAGSGSIEAGP